MSPLTAGGPGRTAARPPRAALACATLLVSGLLLGGPLAGDAHALARMSLTAGTPCSACHTNMQGGGMRTDIGWGSMQKVGALTWGDLGVNALHEQRSNAWLDERVAVGVDIRSQLAKLGAPRIDPATGDTVEPERRFFPMQLQPYMSVRATDWLSAYGSYYVGPNTLSDGEVCDQFYAGQACYTAAAVVKTGAGLPTIRAGNIQPSIGIRPDDHTMMIRGDASQPRNPIIAPNYAELGAEANWHPVHWFAVDAGAYRARGLSDAIGNRDVVGQNALGYNARVTFSPRFDIPLGGGGGGGGGGDDGFGEDDGFGGGDGFGEDDGGGDGFGGDAPSISMTPQEKITLTSWAGGSFYGADSFAMVNGFVGLGWLDHAALMGEVSWSTRGSDVDHTTFNWMVHTAVDIFDWLVLEGRVENARTERLGVAGMETFETWHYVAGLQFFPVPYLELRPEYRYLMTDEYILGQYTLQVHFFY
jgi:hypothetical protein